MQVEHDSGRNTGAPTFDDCLSADRPRLRRMARDLRRPAGGKAAGSSAREGGDGRAGDRRARLQAEFDALLERSRAALTARIAAVPQPDFPAELPVSGRREEIAGVLAAHQVIIVCGETGSGKTTQLPKICLALGRGAAGLIGHTQPRRLAARATATRIAQEL
ncbi:MAG: ATP-dependent helicase, partial [Proteobacteria bacterium]|nr:ATP-dependent helicase [Pseudomonadota bacterium]